MPDPVPRFELVPIGSPDPVDMDALVKANRFRRWRCTVPVSVGVRLVGGAVTRIEVPCGAEIGTLPVPACPVCGGAWREDGAPEPMRYETGTGVFVVASWDPSAPQRKQYTVSGTFAGEPKGSRASAVDFARQLVKARVGRVVVEWWPDGGGVIEVVLILDAVGP